MPTLPANIAAKLRSGLLTEQEVDDRVRFWSEQGCDMSEWSHAPRCPHYSKGCCRLAAVIAKTPVDHARIQTECRACQRETSDPEISNVPKVVADLADRAKKSHFSRPTSKVAKPTVKVDAGMDEETAFKKFPCIYREKTDQKHKCKSCGGGGRLHTLCNCLTLHRQCTVLAAADAKDPTDGKRVATCLTCEHREEPVVPHTNYLTTIHGKPADLSGMYQGGTCVLVCGGPSLNETDLTPIHQRGITISAINNVGATHVRPHLWFGMDAMRKFHPAILFDPAVTCFVNNDHLDGYLRLQIGEDWKQLDRVRACPNVYAFQVKGDAVLNPENFMGGPFSYRMPNDAGNPRSATMAAALRILLDLGFKRIGIVGADFHMGTDVQYAWDEPKDKRAQGTNNNLYRMLNDLFTKAWPGIQRQGREVWNCSVGGNLTAFPRMELAEFCRTSLEKFPAFISAKGYYVDKPGG
jgi:hypothetical protein